ncbi:cytochrome b6-f complex subunit 7, chloroplastic-like [Musa acuminata AAA Group]|uniref:cytochrome b6-f complex subunit 7, chloroplastic-like n=1 Tax=Musa acuminata AAA Group TaxID=214697 RepID=UPI0031D1CA80
MAAISAAAAAAVPAAAAVSCSSLNSSMRRKHSVKYMQGMNSFGGLKANNNVSSLGLPACTAASFAKVLSSLRAPPKGKTKSKGGALSSTCNAAEEIFRIAAIMNGLVLVGVAVGFVLLRVEAWVEESES